MAVKTGGVVPCDKDTMHDSSDDVGMGEMVEMVEMVEMGDAFNETFRQSDERYTMNPMSTLKDTIAIHGLLSIHHDRNTERKCDD